MVKLASQRTGAVLPLIAVFIAAFLFVAALTINSNWFMLNQTNIQSTADISARASLQKIVSDSVGKGRLDRARDLGVRLYDLNIIRNGPGFDPKQIRFGNLSNAAAGDPEFVETFNEKKVISAVHVDSPAQLEQQNVEVFFAQLLGAGPQVKIVADAKTSTRPVDIILCLDASRSMNRTPEIGKNFPPGGNSIHEPPLPGSRWFALADTVAVFLDAMQDTNPNARVGLVTFGGGFGPKHEVVSALDADWARFEKELTVVVADDISDITDTMNSYSQELPALGLGTSLFDGINFSRDAFLNDTNSSKHIVMLSDGSQAAPGRSNPIIAAQAASDEDIKIHTISFGADLPVMENIANETGGQSFEAVSDDQLREAFAQLLGRFRIQLVD